MKSLVNLFLLLCIIPLFICVLYNFSLLKISPLYPFMTSKFSNDIQLDDKVLTSTANIIMACISLLGFFNFLFFSRKNPIPNQHIVTHSSMTECETCNTSESSDINTPVSSEDTILEISLKNSQILLAKYNLTALPPPPKIDLYDTKIDSHPEYLNRKYLTIIHRIMKDFSQQYSNIEELDIKNKDNNDDDSDTPIINNTEELKSKDLDLKHIHELENKINHLEQENIRLSSTISFKQTELNDKEKELKNQIGFKGNDDNENTIELKRVMSDYQRAQSELDLVKEKLKKSEKTHKRANEQTAIIIGLRSEITRMKDSDNNNNTQDDSKNSESDRTISQLRKQLKDLETKFTNTSEEFESQSNLDKQLIRDSKKAQYEAELDSRVNKKLLQLLKSQVKGLQTKLHDNGIE